MRVLEEVALVVVIVWFAIMAATFALVFVESWAALWRKLDELARTRRRWWGPS